MATQATFLSARDAASITPADSDLARVADAVYVGGLGNLAVQTVDGTTLTFSSVPAGTILPVKCSQIRSTNTTATNIVALYE